MHLQNDSILPDSKKAEVHFSTFLPLDCPLELSMAHQSLRLTRVSRTLLMTLAPVSSFSPCHLQTLFCTTPLLHYCHQLPNWSAGITLASFLPHPHPLLPIFPDQLTFLSCYSSLKKTSVNFSYSKGKKAQNPYLSVPYLTLFLSTQPPTPTWLISVLTTIMCYIMTYWSTMDHTPWYQEIIMQLENSCYLVSL
jgi:hypothetical protein